jgi:hypothetical protein
MSYELKEEFFYTLEDGRYRAHDIYHFLFDGYSYIAEIYFRPDDLNGGVEMELNYKTEFGYEQISVKNVFKLYKIISDCYLKSILKMVKKVPEITPHFKLEGISVIDGISIRDKQKDKIAINYIKKVLPVENIFLDLNDNTIVSLNKNNLSD